MAAGLLAIGCKSEPRESPMVAAMKQCDHDAELSCPRPIFGVRDVVASQAYYRDKLGFTIDWTYGEPPDFGSVSRAETVVFLGESRGTVGGGWLWVFARDLDALHRELVHRGANIKLPPTEMEWGVREMHVLDLDGNTLRVAGASKR